MQIPWRVEFPPDIDGKGPFVEAEYLKKDGHMKGLYLGQCLDSCRWGSIMTIMYEMNTLEMAEFIKNWMEQNKSNLKFHYEDLPADFELPYVKHDVCPRNSKHKIRNMGLDGTIRCIDEDVKEIKKDYLETMTSYDEYSKSRRKEHWEAHPLSGCFEDEEEEAMREYEEATEMVTIRERCGAILSEKGFIFPLTEILDRLNIFPGSRGYCKTDVCFERIDAEILRECFGHPVQDHFVVPFDGWTLARYAQKWYEQPPKGTAPLSTHQLTKKIVRKTTTPDRFEKELEKWQNII